MPEIYPKMSRSELENGADQTSEGQVAIPLPGVQTDVKHAEATDRCAYQANRELAELIKAAVRAKKNSDEHGAHFVLGWRLYPNKDHPRWNAQEHSCGCGCGCSV